MKKCIKCGSYVSNPKYDYCHECWEDLESEEGEFSLEDSFALSLMDRTVSTVYVMLYGDKEKIGYTNDMHSRLAEIKREYPENKFVYFREFVKESEARRYEAWLKDLSKREIMKIITDFQNKKDKIEGVY